MNGENKSGTAARRVAESVGATPVSPIAALAPMATITDSAMRVICAQFGAQKCYTEMVSAEGLAHHSARTFQLLEKLPEEGPVVAHLYGADPDAMARAAEIVTATGWFCGIDVNAGCPVRKVTKCGAGAALMRDPPRIGKIVAAIAAHTHLPVSVKTRIGLHPGAVTIFDVAKIAADAGAAAIAVHGRFASDEHKGDVNLPLLRAAVDTATLPVIVNGGIKTAADALHLLRETGAAGIMIGRGAMGNPWLFRDIRAALDSEKCSVRSVNGESKSGVVIQSGIAAHAPDVNEILSVLRRHLELSIRHKALIRDKYPEHLWPCVDPELAAVHDFRRFMFNYFKGRPGAVGLRRQMNAYTSIADIMSAVTAYVAR